jgi:hypothetical protein
MVSKHLITGRPVKNSAQFPEEKAFFTRFTPIIQRAGRNASKLDLQ